MPLVTILPLGGLDSPLFIPALGTLALVGQFALIHAMPHLEDVFEVTLLLTALAFWLASMIPLEPWARIADGGVGWTLLYLLVGAARFLTLPLNLTILFLTTECPDQGLQPYLEALATPLPWGVALLGAGLATVRLPECGPRPTAVGLLLLLLGGSLVASLLV